MPKLLKSLRERTPDEQELYSAYKAELDKIFDCLRLNKKQKELLNLHFLSLKETYFFKGERAFNRQYTDVKGLGRGTKKVLIASFKNN